MFRRDDIRTNILHLIKKIQHLHNHLFLKSSTFHFIKPTSLVSVCVYKDVQGFTRLSTCIYILYIRISPCLQVYLVSTFSLFSLRQFLPDNTLLWNINSLWMLPVAHLAMVNKFSYSYSFTLHKILLFLFY